MIRLSLYLSLSLSLLLCGTGVSPVIPDLATFRTCSTRPTVWQSVDWCRYLYDYDLDGDVDADDFGAFQRGDARNECGCSAIIGLDGAVMLGAGWVPLPMEVHEAYAAGPQANFAAAFEYGERSLLPDGECVSYDCYAADGTLLQSFATRWEFSPLIEDRITDMCQFVREAAE